MTNSRCFRRFLRPEARAHALGQRTFTSASSLLQCGHAHGQTFFGSSFVTMPTALPQCGQGTRGGSIDGTTVFEKLTNAMPDGIRSAKTPLLG